jgi:HSP20 family protein
MFDEIIHRVWGRSEWQPAADLLETTHTYILEIDLPGIEENTVQVKVVDRRLIVEGDRKIQYPEDLVQMHVSERPAGRFIRSFEFKDLLDLERIKRFHSNGILTLIIPKQNSEEGV